VEPQLGDVDLAADEAVDAELAVGEWLAGGPFVVDLAKGAVVVALEPVAVGVGDVGQSPGLVVGVSGFDRLNAGCFRPAHCRFDLAVAGPHDSASLRDLAENPSAPNRQIPDADYWEPVAQSHLFADRS